MADLYKRPAREVIAARVTAELSRCERCGYGKRPMTLGHFWACVLPRLERRRA